MALREDIAEFERQINQLTMENGKISMENQRIVAELSDLNNQLITATGQLQSIEQ